MCSASMRRNWSFQALISPRRVSSRRKHWSFHCWASWRSCEINSAWCLFCDECGEGREGGQVSQLGRNSQKNTDDGNERSSPLVTHYLPAVSGERYSKYGGGDGRWGTGQCAGRASAFHRFTSATHARVCSLHELRSLRESSRSCRRTRRSSSAWLSRARVPCS